MLGSSFHANQRTFTLRRLPLFTASSRTKSMSIFSGKSVICSFLKLARCGIIYSNSSTKGTTCQPTHTLNTAPITSQNYKVDIYVIFWRVQETGRSCLVLLLSVVQNQQFKYNSNKHKNSSKN